MSGAVTDGKPDSTNNGPQRLSSRSLLAGVLAGAALMLLAGGHAPPASEVLAWIDDEPVTLAEYQRHLLRMHGLSELETYLDDRLLLQEAARNHVTLPYEKLDPLVEQRLTETHAIFKRDPGGFEKSLARRGLTVADFRRQLERKVLRAHALAGVLAARNAPPAVDDTEDIDDTEGTGDTEGAAIGPESESDQAKPDQSKSVPGPVPTPPVTDRTLLKELRGRVRLDPRAAQDIVNEHLARPPR